MARALALTAGGLAAVLAGCNPFGSGAYTCTTNEQCNAQGIGICQPNASCSYPDSSCDSGQRYGDNAGGNSGVCVGQEQGGMDGGVDSRTDGPPMFCYGMGLVKPCFSAVPTGDITLPAMIDTGTASTQCSKTVTGADNYCVIAANSIQVDATVVATGARPLVLVAVTTITVAATLDVASHISPARVGAGAGSPDCGPGIVPIAGGGGGGGAGGSFGGAGGAGGNGGSGGTSGKPATIQTPTILRGGCPGQDGIKGTFGVGGKGGGAVYLIADTSITISGAINASGEGGHAGETGSAGGGGGGSGGMIGLDSPTIDNTGVVFANGASGGEGSGVMTAGNPGPEPTGTAASSPPLGATGNGGDGGGGSGGGASTGGTGTNGTGGTTPGGGGGGGGGIGVIKVYRGTLTGMHSP